MFRFTAGLILSISGPLLIPLCLRWPLLQLLNNSYLCPQLVFCSKSRLILYQGEHRHITPKIYKKFLHRCLSFYVCRCPCVCVLCPYLIVKLISNFQIQRTNVCIQQLHLSADFDVLVIENVWVLMSFMLIVCDNRVAWYYNELHFYFIESGHNIYCSLVMCCNGIYNGVVPATNLCDVPFFLVMSQVPRQMYIKAESNPLDSNLRSSWSIAFLVCKPLWHQNSTKFKDALFCSEKPLLSDKRIGVWNSDPWGAVGGLLSKACIFGPDGDIYTKCYTIAIENYMMN